MSLRIYKKRCCGITQIAFISEHVQKLGECTCDRPGVWVEQVIDPSCVHSTTTVTSTPLLDSFETGYELTRLLNAEENREYQLKQLHYGRLK